MSLRVVDEGSSNAHLLQERNYMGLPDSTEGSSETAKSNLNLKATELRLGLPGCRSPERSHEKSFFPLHPIASVHSAMRNKRGFSDAMDEVKHNCVTDVKSPSQKVNSEKETEANNGVSVAKAQVVGWPPIRSFRKNSLVAARNAEEGEKGTLFVKVSMDGAPYLRKVDLANYGVYRDLSTALEKMFSFTLGSEYVLTYEDKDGDWMLVGDVPWPMFIENCRKLRIMKSSDAIGLAPRSAEKGKFQS